MECVRVDPVVDAESNDESDVDQIDRMAVEPESNLEPVGFGATDHLRSTDGKEPGRKDRGEEQQQQQQQEGRGDEGKKPAAYTKEPKSVKFQDMPLNKVEEGDSRYESVEKPDGDDSTFTTAARGTSNDAESADEWSAVSISLPMSVSERLMMVQTLIQAKYEKVRIARKPKPSVKKPVNTVVQQYRCDAMGRRGKYTGVCCGRTPNGIGRMWYAEGDLKIFEGKWKNGTWTWGTQTFTSGEKYIGQFLHFRFHGKGKLSALNGNTYNGFWYQGKKQGEGVLTCASGDAYVGCWHEDNRHGEGTYRHRTGWEISGTWKKGMLRERSKLAVSSSLASQSEMMNLQTLSSLVSDNGASDALDCFVSLGGIQWLKDTIRNREDDYVCQHASSVLGGIAKRLSIAA